MLKKIWSSPDLLKSIKNMAWLSLDKFLRMGVGLFVGVWMARYLGPEDFGRISYGTSVIGLLAVLTNFGTNNVLVKEIARNGEGFKRIVNNGLTLQILTGLLSLVLCVSLASSLSGGDAQTEKVIIFLGITLLFKPTDVFKYWFEAETQSKYVVLIESAALLLLSGYRIVLILNNGSLMWFVGSMVVEAAIIGISLWFVYRGINGKITLVWRGRLNELFTLAKCSFPLMLSGMAVSVYMRIDQVMLGEMADIEAVGEYAAALKLSELWYFIPGIITTSVFPKMLETYDKNLGLYYERLKKLFLILAAISIIVGLVFTLLSDWIVGVVYGDRFSDAGNVLRIHIWTGVFVSLGLASSGWYLNEGLNKLILHRTLLGAAINILLNILLIPNYGAIGAAWGTLAGQAGANYLFDLSNKKTWKIFSLKTQSIFLDLGNRHRV